MAIHIDSDVQRLRLRKTGIGWRASDVNTSNIVQLSNVVQQFQQLRYIITEISLCCDRNIVIYEISLYILF